MTGEPNSNENMGATKKTEKIIDCLSNCKLSFPPSSPPTKIHWKFFSSSFSFRFQSIQRVRMRQRDFYLIHAIDHRCAHGLSRSRVQSIVNIVNPRRRRRRRRNDKQSKGEEDVFHVENVVSILLLVDSFRSTCGSSFQKLSTDQFQIFSWEGDRVKKVRCHIAL